MKANRNKFLLGAVLAFCGMGVLFAVPVLAQVGIDPSFAQAAGLPETDIRVSIAKIIRIALSMLGIIAVVLVVYGGFLWMTAGGNDEKVGKAKKVLINALIGLLIIMFSFAITQFVLSSLLRATGSEIITESDLGPPGGLGTDPFADSFIVTGATPQGQQSIRNIEVKLSFNRPVDPESIHQIKIYPTGTKVSETMQYKIFGNEVKFVSNTPCPSPNEDKFCLAEQTEYKIQIGSSLKSIDGKFISCNGFAPPCNYIFTTGSLVDTEKPTVRITDPSNWAIVPVNSVSIVSARATDNSGVGAVSFFVNDRILSTAVPPLLQTPKEWTAAFEWDTAGLATGSTHTLAAQAEDIDSNTSDKSSVQVVVRPLHCFDNEINFGETGLNCGGDPNSAEYCGACKDESCTEGGQCAGGLCENGVCVSYPEITGVNPGNGAFGNYITISGRNFGTSKGKVLFIGAVEQIEAQLADCEFAWQNSQIIVKVPDGAVDGPLVVLTKDGLFDSTNDLLRGNMIPDFDVNDVKRPGLCALSPNSGKPGTETTATGFGFGSAQAGGVMWFGQIRAAGYNSWNNSQIRGIVPNAKAGVYDVAVVADGGATSNKIKFAIKDVSLGVTPEITSIEPALGPVGEYITIIGSLLGSRPGTVFFENKETGDKALGDANFPDQCTQDYWHENSVTIKVPAEYQNNTPIIKNDDYSVYIARAGDNAQTNKLNFTINDSVAGPGLCSINPTSGPVGYSPVVFAGERFGNGGAESSVIFSGRLVPSPILEWTDTLIKAAVHIDAVTGRVFVETEGKQSNPVNFQVVNCNDDSEVCTNNTVCCSSGICAASALACQESTPVSHFQWDFSTGNLPDYPKLISACTTEIKSPSPISSRDGESICRNAIVSGWFDRAMNENTLASNITVRMCTGADANRPCETLSDPIVRLPGARFVVTYTDPSTGTERTIFVFKPQNILESQKWYQVTIAVGATSITGVPLKEQISWTFKTSDKECDVDSVMVVPAKALIDEQYSAVEPITGVQDLDAVPVSPNFCVLLNPDRFDWDWRAVPYVQPPDRIVVVKDSTVASAAQAQAIYETIDSDTPQDAEATETKSGKKGISEISVVFKKPRVTNYWPNCGSACVNAAIGGEFNIKMNESSVETSGNIVLSECLNELCLSFTPVGIPYSVSYSEVDNAPITFNINFADNSKLSPNKYYRVQVFNRVMSPSSVALDGTNFQNSFSWVFKTRQDGTPCRIDSIDVEPESVTLSVIGSRTVFNAIPFGPPDECSVEGQRLQGADENYDWTIIDDPDRDPNNAVLATYINASSSQGDLLSDLIDTNNDLALGCTESCVKKGSLPTRAVCGNRVLETGEDCDDGNINNSDGCSRSCLYEGFASIASDPAGLCGNGNIDNYSNGLAVSLGGLVEECDNGGVCADGKACVRDSDCAVQSGICNEGLCSDRVTACAVNADCPPVVIDNACVPKSGDGCSDSCLNEGSSSIRAVCGNSDRAWDAKIGGEDCDDGNSNSNDGCSNQCLREGSIPQELDQAFCGNSAVDFSEECDDGGTASGDGCSAKCLFEGANPVSANGTCGNLIKNIGEAYDDGNQISGDGISSRCLYEGSSYKYARPSFCADGSVGAGEDPDCEVAGGDGLIDKLQTTEINSTAGIEVDPNTHIGSASLSASADGATGEAALKLSCACQNDLSCGSPSTLGCGTGACCFERPQAISWEPGEIQNACRNAQVSISFDQLMDSQTFNRIRLALASTPAECPKGYTRMEVLTGMPPVPGAQAVRGTWFSRLWFRMFDFVRDAFIQKVYAIDLIPDGIIDPSLLDIIPVVPVDRIEIDINRVVKKPEICVLDADYKSTDNAANETTVYYSYKQALEPNMQYKLLLYADPNINDSSVVGIKSKNGVGVDGSSALPGGMIYMGQFTTGANICTFDQVKVEDLDVFKPNMFTRLNEQHDYHATAISIANGAPQAIQSIANMYDWDWKQTWTIVVPEGDMQADDVARVAIVSGDQEGDDAVVTAQKESAYINVIADAKILHDTVNTPSTVNSRVGGLEDANVFLCEVPWPDFGQFPFEDKLNGSNPGAKKRIGWTNFSFYYCRDEIDSDEDPVAADIDDLPQLGITSVPIPPVGILKEYIFPITGTSDAIGVRVATNPDYLTPLEWYRSKGFTGSPELKKVNGFEAVRDGRTIYVSAVNLDVANKIVIYPNIYIISYNEGASPETIDIFDQTVKNFRFAIHETVTLNSHNVCVDGSAFVVDENGRPVYCTKDSDCQTGSCQADKAKMTRDLKRLMDLRQIADIIADYGIVNGRCSSTRSQACSIDAHCTGSETCVPSVPDLAAGTFLRSKTLSAWPSWTAELGNALGQNLPTDPLNEFGACPEGYDSETCWNGAENKFICPADSYIYRYQSIAGDGYSLEAQLERDKGASRRWEWNYPIDKTPNDKYILRAHGAWLRATGFLTAPLCSDATEGDSDVCGDGIQGEDEACEIGMTQTAPCEPNICANPTDPTKNGLICSDNSICGINGSCLKVGNKTVSCVKDAKICRYELESESGAVCVPERCGNGVKETGEACDDAELNGTYGHCSLSCDGIGPFYCGDGTLSGGEQCDYGIDDGGIDNGQYNANPQLSCSWDCKLPGAHCGDAIINGGEQCDFTSEKYAGALCSGGDSDGEPCETDTDCPNEGSCGGATSTGVACEPARVCVSGAPEKIGTICFGDAACDSYPNFEGKCSVNLYPTSRLRTCNQDVSDPANACKWNQQRWSFISCTADAFCGDGIKNGNEKCDDGNASDNDACTNSCEPNVCGDSKLFIGAESCDFGSGNGTPCTAPYGGLCNFCTNTCQYQTKSGPFCGDGIINGSEFCDGTSVAMTVGACNGGANNGQECSDASQCQGGTCEPPVCSSSCVSSCPFSYETGTVLVRSETAGSSLQDSVSLYNFNNSQGNTPDGASLSFPVCRLGTGMTADISFTEQRPAVDVVFAVELSASMGNSIEPGVCILSSNNDEACHSDADCQAPLEAQAALPPQPECVGEEHLIFLKGECINSGVGNGAECENDAVCLAASQQTPQTALPPPQCSGETQYTMGVCIFSGANNDNQCWIDSVCVYEAPATQTMSTSIPPQCIGETQFTRGECAFSGVNNGDKCWNDSVCVYEAPSQVELSQPTAVHPPQCVGESEQKKIDLLKIQLKNTIMKMFDNYEPGRLRIMLVNVKDGVSMTPPIYSDNEQQLLNSIDTYSASGGANMQYALETIADIFEQSTLDKKVLVVFSDGEVNQTSLQIDNVATQLKNSEIKIYTAAITSFTDYIDAMAHWSSDVCDSHSVYDISDGEVDCEPTAEGEEFAYSASSADEMQTMSEQITGALTGAFMKIITGTNQFVIGAIRSGTDVQLPFPLDFACENTSFELPFQVSFSGSGALKISNIRFEHCPR